MMTLNNGLQNIEGIPKFYSLIFHRYMGVAVYTFAELGIADVLVDASVEGLNAESISVTSKLKPDLVYRLLRSCADAGIVERVGPDRDRFVLTPSGKLLVRDNPSGARNLLRCLVGPLCEKPLTFLPDFIRQKISLEEIQKQIYDGMSLYEWMMLPEQAELLVTENDCNKSISTFAGTAVADGVDFSRFRSIVDCGGNEGTFVAQILERHSTVQHGIVFDLPATVEHGTNKSFEIRHIDSKRYEFVGGSVFDVTTIPPNADAYILKNILDAYDDDKVIAIMSNIRQAVCTRAEKQRSRTLFIVGMIILPENSIEASRVNWLNHGLDLMLSVLVGSAERTVEHYKQLLEKAGIEFIKLHPIGQPESAIEARIGPIL